MLVVCGDLFIHQVCPHSALYSSKHVLFYVPSTVFILSSLTLFPLFPLSNHQLTAFISLTLPPFSSLASLFLSIVYLWQKKDADLQRLVKVHNLSLLSGVSSSWVIWKLKPWQLMCWMWSEGPLPSLYIPQLHKHSHKHTCHQRWSFP